MQKCKNAEMQNAEMQSGVLALMHYCIPALMHPCIPVLAATR
jgi:hypothetical protein